MTDMKKRVLFLCIHNSARSQMAAAYLQQMAGDRFEVESAGLEPGKLNPLAVAAMRDAGIDISRNGTQSVFDLFKSGRRFEYVISVCDAASAERCPIFPGVHHAAELELRRSVGVHRQRGGAAAEDDRRARRDPGEGPDVAGEESSQRLYKTR